MAHANAHLTALDEPLKLQPRKFLTAKMWMGRDLNKSVPSAFAFLTTAAGLFVLLTTRPACPREI